MPEAAIAAPPAPPAAPPSPAPAAAPAAPAQAAPESAPQTTEQKAMGEIEGILNRGTKKPTETAPTANGEEGEFESIIKPNRKAWKAYEGFKAKTSKELAELPTLREKLKALESKAVAAPADAGKIATLEKQIAEIEQDRNQTRKLLAETDYSKSDEFRQNYVAKWQARHREASDMALRFGVIVKGEEGEPDKMRAATQYDFEYVRSMPVELRRKAATERFGENGADVVDAIKDLERIAQDGQEAIARHAETHQKTLEEKQRASKTRLSQLDQRKQEIQQAIEDGMPDLFSVKHYESDPDAASALQDGYEKADAGLKELLSFSDSTDVETHAQRLASFRSLIASTPLLALQNARLTEEVESLKEELGKYRKTDPGTAPGTPPSEKKEGDEEVGSIEQMAGKFKRG